MKVTVLSGGFNYERNAALCGSTYVVDALRKCGHKVALIDMYMGIEDYSVVNIEEIFDANIPEKWRVVSPFIPNLKELEQKRKFKSNSKMGLGVLELLKMSDVVFLSIGSDYGEDGRIQGLLDILGIPYTGSKHTGNAIAIDKTLAKEIASYHGIKTATWKEYDNEKSIFQCKSFTFPCVVKNPVGGSSIGTYIVKNKKEFNEAIFKCFQIGSRVLIEDFVQGREFSCGILQNNPLPPIEIKTKNHNYQNKYCNAVEEICPADIPLDIEQKIKNTALAIHQVFRLSNYSRSDFILADDGTLYFLECNVLPGLTPNSLLPKEAMAIGIGYSELCNIILNSAFTNVK